VDAERIDSLDVTPEEVAQARLDMPPGAVSRPPDEEIERSVKPVLAGERLIPDLSQIPEVYHPVIRLYWEHIK